MNVSGVYDIRNVINDKVYVGSAVCIKRRFSDHKKALRTGKHHCTHLQNAWDKYGPDAFVFEVLEEVDPCNLVEREQFHMDRYPKEQRYNICITAYSQLGVKRSEKTIEKMRESAKTRKRPGPSTDEHKRNIAQALKGRVRSLEAIAKTAEAHRGMKHSPESKEKIAAAKRGKPGTKVTDEVKARIALSHTGMKASEAAKEKMRAAKLGRKLSEETRQKMREAHKARYEAKRLKEQNNA